MSIFNFQIYTLKSSVSLISLDLPVILIPLVYFTNSTPFEYVSCAFLHSLHVYTSTIYCSFPRVLHLLHICPGFFFHWLSLKAYGSCFNTCFADSFMISLAFPNCTPSGFPCYVFLQHSPLLVIHD